VRYISTRGQADPLDFENVLLAGLARDGGLYVPESWPRFTDDDFRAMRGQSYAEIAFKVMRPFVAESIDEASLKAIIDGAYARFDHEAVTPLVQIGSSSWLMELWHGPTLAFKDVAMQLVGRMFDHVLDKRG
jgi:threonine synthase